LLFGHHPSTLEIHLIILRMVYKVIGLMSGSSLDGLDIAYVHLQEISGKWKYEIVQSDCYAYDDVWMNRLRDAITLSALDYQLLHTAFGRYIGEQVNRFIQSHGLDYQVQLVASHGHTTFHVPAHHMTAQLGDGATIAAVTGLPVVSDLRAMDLALGGQGAPIVPIGEQLLLGDYDFFLNLGGIANISGTSKEGRVAFDICAANRVLNMLVAELDMNYDEGGQIAAKGMLQPDLLKELSGLDYYKLPYPKSLANDFGTDVVYPLIQDKNYPVADKLRTYVEHIAATIADAVLLIDGASASVPIDGMKRRLLATGGGAFNTFVVDRLREVLAPLHIEVVVPDEKLVLYKEALVMALMGVLRWREENNVLSSVTGASRDSIGGAVWMGLEA
jgi:anhydro-N-acetylmuramic acid kinase